MPEPLRGKTASEVARMVQEALTANTAPPTPPPASNNGLPTDTDHLMRPADAALKTAQLVAQQATTPLLRQMAAMIQTQAKTLYADEYKRWGSEIDGWLAKVPPEQLTLDHIEGAVNLVRGKHLNELVEERAKQVMAQGGFSERTNGGMAAAGGASGQVDLTQLPGGLDAIASREGLSIQNVLDFCKATNMSPEQWMSMAKDQKIVTSAGKFGFTMTPEALGAKEFRS